MTETNRISYYYLATTVKLKCSRIRAERGVYTVDMLSQWHISYECEKLINIYFGRRIAIVILRRFLRQRGKIRFRIPQVGRKLIPL